MEAPLPPNESARIRALLDLDILDTPAEARFDRITRLAQQLVGTPIVLISLVDAERQWFKSRVGLDADETPREFAFCAHAILESKVLVVGDATQDERFHDNPLVVGQPLIRFYAGAPLALDEESRLGTLCAIDTKPRELTPAQERGLIDLAAVVIDELRLRKHVAEMREAKAALETRTQQLQHANGALEQFAYLAAHDLRAPAKRLMSLADLAGQTTGEMHLRTLGYIKDSAKDMDALVAGYRKLAKLSIDAAAPAKVSALVASALERHRGDDAVTALELHVAGDALVECDVALMTSVFSNLLSNAARYAEDQRVDIEIRDGVDTASISVTNRASIGLVADQSALLPFKRLHSDERGSGLGLAIVDRIVGLHGGSVAVCGKDGLFRVDVNLPKKRPLA